MGQVIGTGARHGQAFGATAFHFGTGLNLHDACNMLVDQSHDRSLCKTIPSLNQTKRLALSYTTVTCSSELSATAELSLLRD